MWQWLRYVRPLLFPDVFGVVLFSVVAAVNNRKKSSPAFQSMVATPGVS
jgi:hypothetical protein